MSAQPNRLASQLGKQLLPQSFVRHISGDRYKPLVNFIRITSRIWASSLTEVARDFNGIPQVEMLSRGRWGHVF